MSKKTIVYGDEARAKLAAGVDTIAQAVGVTLGPRGRHVMIDRLGNPQITKDGVTVAREVELDTPISRLGAQMARNASTATVAQSGDGTTTTMILTQAMVKNARKLLTGNSSLSPVLMQKGMMRASTLGADFLRSISRKVESPEEIAKIASLSSNGDHHLGALIAQACETAGEEGVIMVEEGKGIQTVLEFEEGYCLDRGYFDVIFCGDPSKTEIELEDAFILICNKKLTDVHESKHVLQWVVSMDRPLIVIAHDFGGDFLKAMYQNSIAKNINVVPVVAPLFGDKRDILLEDLAVLTGGMVIDDMAGITFKSVEPQDMIGIAHHVRVTKTRTILFDCTSDAVRLEQRIRHAQHFARTSPSEYDKEFHQRRGSYLGGGMAIIRVGAQTEAEMKAYKARVEDALAATKAVIKDGFVLGGGMAYLKTSEYLKGVYPQMSFATEDEEVGYHLVCDALEAPLVKLLENAQLKQPHRILYAAQDLGFEDGAVYDVARGEWVDGYRGGIIDPTLVVLSSLHNSVSTASTLMMVEAVIGISDMGEFSPFGIDLA